MHLTEEEWAGLLSGNPGSGNQSAEDALRRIFETEMVALVKSYAELSAFLKGVE